MKPFGDGVAPTLGAGCNILHRLSAGMTGRVESPRANAFVYLMAVFPGGEPLPRFLTT
ncbi:MAG: hypothetical protein R6U34_04925 [Thioalkalivibrio sp.]